jgi:hypothetical protein
MTKENKYKPGHPEFLKEAERLGLTGYQYMRRLVIEGILPDPTNVLRKERGWNPPKGKVSKLDPKYRVGHPEFIKEAERLGLTGYQYMRRLVEEGTLPNPTDINMNRWKDFLKMSGFNTIKEYQDICCQKKGFENSSAYKNEWRYDKGLRIPMEDDESCPQYLGILVGERKIARFVLPIILGKIKEEMPNNCPGYEFIVDTKEGDVKVDVKTTCLLDGDRVWSYDIRYNETANCFLLIAIDNRYDLNILHFWLIYKDQMIRKRSGKGNEIIIEKFYKRHDFAITNKSEKLEEFKKYDQIDKLKDLKEWKELCEEIKREHGKK